MHTRSRGLNLACLTTATALLSLLVGCGGGGGGPSGPQQFTTRITIVDGVSGFDGYVHSVDGAFLSSVLAVGDYEGSTGGYEVSILSFDLSGLPFNANVVGAELTLRSIGFGGTAEADLGDLIAEHVDVGPTLDAGDISGGGLGRSAVMVQSFGGGFTGEVAALLNADIASLRGRTQVRLHYSAFDQNLDGGDDYLWFESSNDATPQVPPSLLLTYIVP